ncbi:LuxR family transcriptional regulator [Mycobacterium intermedium]|uniref:LuxR family transcriptional regulator n=1 Tax=Mycobacterium intermedium TaxID=28445 RepID=A0A1T3W5V5_MYCIE|nr:LuxR family transcriptional regulator [Mycobacterium intermedium]MCV6966451.1 AAA family ATPase [Mycobacterium intermedium]OPE49696.1 LuxR family transcriptional regulator [Mycobacterium intermedium]ORB00709.1 LuxR family transcriptional regulator [Mycobacterium intermedium]
MVKPVAPARYVPLDPPRAPGPIRGRADELKVIGALLTAVTQGRGGVLVIEGPPGIGKSRLLTEVLALAEEAGVRALFGEAFEHQQTVPFFSLFMATLRANPPVGDAEALRRLGTSSDVRYWVVRDLQAAIDAAASRTPLVIILEDIHWADDATLLALRSMTAKRPNAPVLWVLTARTDAREQAVRETLTALERQDATVVRLTTMTPSAIADMVQDVVRANADLSLLSLADMAHGNPFLLTELLLGLNEEGRLDVRGGRAVATGDTLPRRLSDTMQQRLEQLSSAASQVVRVAAVLPDRFSARLLAAMLERQPAALASAVQEAVRADLLIEDGDQIRFGQDLLREATRQSLPNSLRRAMERQSASLMLEMGAAPEEVATQLARSAEVGDQAAIAALREAAQSVANTDSGVASDLSMRALQLLPPDDPGHGPIATETIVLLNRAGRYREAQRLAGVTLSATLAPEEEARIRLRLPTVATDTTMRRIEENRRALQLPDLSGVTRARHRAWLAYNLAMHGQRGQDSTAADEAAAAACTGDVESSVLAGIALACLECANGHVGRALHRMEELQRLAPADNMTAHHLAAMHLTNLLAAVGRIEDAAALIAAHTEQAQMQRDSVAFHIWTLTAGVVHLAAGRLSAARATIESLPAPDQRGPTYLDARRMFMLAEVAVRTDDRPLLLETMSEARGAYSGGSPSVSREAALLLALAAWQRDDIHEAVRWLSGDVSLLVTPFPPNAVDQLTLTARIAATADDAGLRARVLQATEALEREQPPVPLFAAVVGYVRAILDGDADALAGAASALRSSSRPLLYASAAEDAGGELMRVQRDAEALDQLSAAFDTYIECEALADARRVGRALRRLGVERRIVTHPRAKTGWDSLTDSELKIINLIAQGATNRAVAGRLHLSTHTVKTHVHNAFAKLGITSRAQLAQLMGGAV